MFTLSLFISRVIGYAKYTDIRRAREKERGREKEKIKSAQLFLTSEEQSCRADIRVYIYIYISVLSHNHRLEETKMFLILIGSAILTVYVSLVKVKVKY